MSFGASAQRHIATLLAGENITAPAWVGISGGEWVLANLSNGAATGVMLVTTNDGVSGQVFMPSSVIDWPGGGLTVGATYYLSSSTPGAMTTTATSPLSQIVGYALTADQFLVSPGTRATAQEYAVGAVYVSTVSTNPATLLGYGTWEAFGTGRTLVGIDAGQTEFDTNGETGGAKTHTLTESEMPAHTHTYEQPSAPVASIPVGVGVNNSVQSRSSQSTGSTGGGSAHNILQPYVVCYFWKRTA